jgi:hypothetical protein
VPQYGSLVGTPALGGTFQDTTSLVEAAELALEPQSPRSSKYRIPHLRRCVGYPHVAYAAAFRVAVYVGDPGRLSKLVQVSSKSRLLKFADRGREAAKHLKISALKWSKNISQFRGYL